MIYPSWDYHLIIFTEDQQLIRQSFHTPEDAKRYLEKEITFPVVHCHLFHGQDIFDDLCKEVP